jgi:peptidoglycan/LPS O-acetylase OafA/YrhL
MPKSAIPSANLLDEKFSFSKNNFDLIRLIAAGEVAFRHSTIHIAPSYLPQWLDTCLALIPGVPIFFFLSGYLISRAWERSATASDYVYNRVLRLFPALWVCTAVTVAALFASGYMSTIDWKPLKFLVWVACQVTACQFWNPDFLRGFGVGVLNGSLWTISVEIQFYIVIAVLYRVFRQLPCRDFTGLLCALAVAAAVVSFLSPQILRQLAVWTGGDVAGKLFEVSFFPWIYMFLLGAIAQRTSNALIPILLNYPWQTISMYVAALLIDFHFYGVPLGNSIPFYLVPIMGAFVLTCGYSCPSVAGRILHRNDVSYGLYIYHMPVANTVLYSGALSGFLALITSLAISASLALMSWKWIEKPFLRKKRSSIEFASGAQVVPSRVLDGPAV